MNGLVCTAMYEMGRIEHELRARGSLLADELERAATQLGEARHDGDEQLALAQLHRVAERLHVFDGDRRLLDLYAELAMEPLAS